VLIFFGTWAYAYLLSGYWLKYFRHRAPAAQP